MKFLTTHSYWYAIAAIAMLLLVSLAYYPGLHGPFVFDDYSNIVHSSATALADLSFPHLRDAFFPLDGKNASRGLAHLSFALNYYFSGGQFTAWNFKITNLIIHVLNAMLWWFIAHRLLARFASMRGLDETLAGRPWWHWAALLSAFFWMLHPLQLTAVLYIVQRMTSLSALFCLLGLASWICGRGRFESGSKGGLTLMSLGMIVGVGLGMLSKENAILLPFYTLITELIFFRRDTLRPSALAVLRGFFVLFALIPALLAVGIIASHWDGIMASYDGRNFSLGERLLTELRILWYYLQLLVYPNAHSFGIYHDDIVLSRDLLTPVTTITSVFAWGAVLVLAVTGVAKQRLFSFAVIWYLLGHSVESSFLGLELIFEHRNYLPMTGVSLVLSVYLLRALMAISDKTVLRLGVPGLLLLTLCGVTFSRANNWQDKYVLMNAGVNNHPNSPRYHLDFAVVLANKGAEDRDIFQHLQAAVRLSPGDITSLFGMSQIINRQLYKRGEHSGLSDGTGSPVDVRNDLLPTDAAALLAYDAAINTEMLRRIREEVMITNASEMSRYTQSCLSVGDPVCVRMRDRTTVWIRALMENPRQFPEIRAQSALAYAKIVAARDPNAALDAVDEAIRLAPWTMNYRIEKVTLLIALKQLDAATKVLDEAGQYLHWSGRNRAVIELLRQHIRVAKRRQSEPVSDTQP